jgi:hypothetical protein
LFSRKIETMSNNKINKVIDLYNELIMEQGDDTLKTIINSNDFKAKLLTASGQKKLKKSKDPNSPKKPTTAWLLFCNDTRPTLKEANPSLKMSEITSLMSPMWVQLQESKDPDDVAKVAGYSKIVEAERNVYKAAKDKVKAEKPKKVPRNAYQLFMMNERAKPKPDGETFGETTKRMAVAWAQLKENNPEKIEMLTAEVKKLRASVEDSSASETETPSEPEVLSETEAEVTATEEEAEIHIEDILQKMHQEEDDIVRFSEWDSDYMIDKENNIYPKEDTTKAVGKVTDIENGTIEFFEEKPKLKPKGRGKAKKDDATPKQKRPRCKKTAATS